MVESGRFSRQKESILKVLKNTKCHPSAEWIYEQVKRELPNISLGTVYRNLKQFSELGIVYTLETEKGKIHYDGDTSPHAHFICNNCGKIIDIFMLSDLKEKLESKGMRVESEKIVFYGNCEDCNKTKLSQEGN